MRSLGAHNENSVYAVVNTRLNVFERLNPFNNNRELSIPLVAISVSNKYKERYVKQPSYIYYLDKANVFPGQIPVLVARYGLVDCQRRGRRLAGRERGALSKLRRRLHLGPFV